MRRPRLVSILPLVLALPIAATARSAPKEAEAPPGVAWFEGSFAEALAEARARHLPLMVDVYATWCGPCHALDREVFARGDVAAEARHYLPVKLDGESEDGEEVRTRYNVVGFPTVLFLTPEGEEIDRLFGFVPPEEFVRAMQRFREGRGTLTELEAQARQNPLDLELAYQVGFRFAVRGDAEKALVHFARIFAVRRLRGPLERAAARGATDVLRLATDVDGAAVRDAATRDVRGLKSRVDTLTANAYLALGKYLFLRGRKDYRTAIRILSELERRFPDSEAAREAPYQLAVAYRRLGQKKKALSLLRGFLEREGGSVSAVNTVAWFCFKEDLERPWAISLAEKTLAAHPEAAGLWDTLAELRAATGDNEGAIAASRRARAADPDEPYYARQLERFEASAAGEAGARAPKAARNEAPPTKR